MAESSDDLQAVLNGLYDYCKALVIFCEYQQNESSYIFQR